MIAIGYGLVIEILNQSKGEGYMKFVNLTPHDIVISNDYMNIKFPPSGIVARIETTYEQKLIPYEVDYGVTFYIPCQITPRVKVVNLPEPKEGVIYIVSNYVAQVVKRNDLVAPLTDNTAERDEDGNIKSVKAFQSYAEDREVLFEYNDLYEQFKGALEER